VTDTITLPTIAQFKSADAYFATSFHECGHSSGHNSRLDRPGIAEFDHFGSGKYGLEELTAEMTASFLCARTGIVGRFDQSAAYVASWLKTIKGDPKLIVTAASAASKAADLIAPEDAEQQQYGAAA
jgi:antirestriction protein ArdC